MKSPVPNHANKDISLELSMITIRPKKNQKMFKSSSINLSQVLRIAMKSFGPWQRTKYKVR